MFAYPSSDRNRVTVAEPGRALEFVAENRYARHCEGTYVNRYDLTPKRRWLRGHVLRSGWCADWFRASGCTCAALVR
jgi:hypothetical protein